jgi:hypothetical protein
MIDKIYELGPYNVSHHCGTPETLKKINVIDISWQKGMLFVFSATFHSHIFLPYF